MRSAKVPACLVALVCSCGSSQSESTAPVLLGPTDDGGCSELESAIAQWQGREVAACGASVVRYRELLPLGNGTFVTWTPGTGYDELWRLNADDSLGTGPLLSYSFGALRNNTILTSLGPDRVLEYNQKSGAVNLDPVNSSLVGPADIIAATMYSQNWVRPPGGRDLLTLDASHVLDWQPSTGAYDVVQFDRSQETTAPFVRSSAVGRKDAFRRGHRLVPLGSNRLLEWVPSTHEYRVWSYDLEHLPVDIFDMDPAAQGVWPSLGVDQDVVVLAPNKIAIWNRTDGTLQVRPFDPSSADPLAGPTLNVSQDDRLRSRPEAWEKSPMSRIRRLVVLFQQGRAFDTYFGRYCQASEPDPTCEDGPGCCTRMPAAIPGASQCRVLDASDDGYAPNGTGPCLIEKMNGGAMDRFAGTESSDCGDPRDFACVDPMSPNDPVAAYLDFANKGALADRYFASVADSALLNYLYFGEGGPVSDPKPTTIGALIANEEVPWSLYLEDPSINDNQEPPYYFDGRWGHLRYVDEFAYDVSMNQLPVISLITPGPERDEEPGHAGSLSNGVALASQVSSLIAQSPRYASETLVIITHLTSGGFFDHVRPPDPPPPSIEPLSVKYGPRVPFVALGPFVKPGHISHVQLEHCSLTRFIEWNWLDGVTGQLGGRDGVVNNIGSLFDAATTGVPVPDSD